MECVIALNWADEQLKATTSSKMWIEDRQWKWLVDWNVNTHTSIH